LRCYCIQRHHVFADGKRKVLKTSGSETLN